MQLEHFNLTKEDTRLVKCNETVYKVKIAPQRSFESDLPCSSEVAHKQIEDVLRALLYMDQRSVIFKPIHTEHFVITALKKGWKTCQNLIFHLNGEEIKACPYQYILKVDLKDIITTNSEKQVISESHKYSQEHVELAIDSPSHVKSGDTSKNRKSDKGVNDSKQIVETYKNTQSITVCVIGNQPVERNNNNTSLDGESDLNEDKRRKELMEMIRKREKLKRKKQKNKEEVEKLFSDQVNTKSLGKRKKLYKAELYCNTPGSPTSRHFYQTRSAAKFDKKEKKEKATERSRGKMDFSKQLPEDAERTSRPCTKVLYNGTDTGKTGKENTKSLVKDSSPRSTRVDNKLTPVYETRSAGYISSGKKELHIKTKTTGARSRTRKISETSSSNANSATKSSRKAQQNILHQKRKSSSKDSVSSKSKRLRTKTSPHEKVEINSTGRERVKEWKRPVTESQKTSCSSSESEDLSDIVVTCTGREKTRIQKRGVSESSKRSSDSSESVDSFDSVGKKVRYSRRIASLSPQGKAKYRDARPWGRNRLQNSGNQNNNSNLSPDVEVFRPQNPGKARYSLRSRSLSPQGKAKYQNARPWSQNRLQKSGSQNNNSHLSSKIELFRPLKSTGNEFERLQDLKSSTMHDKKRRVTHQQLDRHKVETEEIEESMKLQYMSKSATPPTSKQSSRKRQKSKFWEFVDVIISPVQHVFKS